MSGAWEVTPTGEPFDFRHQARDYARHRRDYSPELYTAIAEATGPGAGRRALDVGCGTGFVAAALASRGWNPVAVDFSAPMLAEAPATLDRVRARGEALPLRAGAAHLVTCGTAFHWMGPRAALAEFVRVLVSGGWVALFWRYPRADEPSARAVDAALAAVGRPLPPGVRHVHSDAPFAGEAALTPHPPRLLSGSVAYTRDEFVGWASTIETFRRVTADDHPRFLARLVEIVRAELPERFTEQNDEYLFLARRA